MAQEFHFYHREMNVINRQPFSNIIPIKFLIYLPFFNQLIPSICRQLQRHERLLDIISVSERERERERDWNMEFN